jgi:two-component system response regulator AtoC
MTTLLIIDDDPLLLESLKLQLEDPRESRAPYRVTTARTAAEGFALAACDPPDLILLDLQLPDRPGLELIEDLKAASGDAPVVVITGRHDTDTIIRAMKAGAFDYLEKPFGDALQLRAVIERAIGVGQISRRAAVAIDPVSLPPIEQLVGVSPAMGRVAKDIGKIAASQATVLIQGESGTGKELVAQVIHAHSGDGARPFVAINCSAIVETLLESELFGHERGAFTGAVNQKIGKCEVAADGTLFLDEIGDMSLGLQSKLLRVLQEREFERVGGVKRIPLQARVIAATHRDLAVEVAQGRFREDLFQRLTVVTLALPPLRDRREDIPALVGYLLRKINSRVRRRVTRIPDEVMRHLVSLPWPGNVRELENVLTRAVVLAPSNVLLMEHFPVSPTPPPALVAAPLDEPLMTLAEMERRQIGRALVLYNGHKGRICSALGISRPTLERKLRKYGLHTEQQTTVDVDDEASGLLS